MNNELKRPEIQRVDEQKLTVMGHGKYVDVEFNYQGKPFTGFVVMDYHDNGNISLEQEYVDGQTMGWEVEYHENGKIKSESLESGATTVVFYEYSETGELLQGGFIAPKELYNEVAEETGMDKIPLD